MKDGGNRPLTPTAGRRAAFGAVYRHLSPNFERNLVAPTIKRLIDEYDIRYDESIVVNSDDDLVDRVFQAGFQQELLHH